MYSKEYTFKFSKLYDGLECTLLYNLTRTEVEEEKE